MLPGTSSSASSSALSDSSDGDASANELAELSTLMRSCLYQTPSQSTQALAISAELATISGWSGQPDNSAVAAAFDAADGRAGDSSDTPHGVRGAEDRRRRRRFTPGLSWRDASEGGVGGGMSGVGGGGKSKERDEKIVVLNSASAVGGGRKGTKYETISGVDTGDDGEEKKGGLLETESTSRWVLSPLEKPRSVFDRFFLLVLLYVATVSVFVYSFMGVLTPSSPFFWLERIVDLTFVVETVLGFFTAYESAPTRFESRLPRIRRHYLCTWFVLDVASTLPLGYIGLLSGGASRDEPSLLELPRFLRVVRTLKAFGILRVMALNQGFTRLEVKYRLRYGYLRMATLGVTIMFVAHWTGCLFYFLGVISERRSGASWLMEEGIPSNRWGQYIAAVYFATKTISTVGYGDITPVSNLERMYVTFLMFLGAAIFAFSVSQLGNIMAEMSVSAAVHRNQLDLVLDFSRARNLPDDLVFDIRRYLQHRHYAQRLDGDEELLEVMSSDLRKRVLIHTYHPTLAKSYLLKDVDSSELCNHMYNRLARPGEELYSPGDASDGLYSVMRGSVEVTDGDGETLSYVEGDVFGERELLLDRPRRTTATCLRYCELAVAPRDNVMALLRRKQNAPRLNFLETEEARMLWEQVLRRAENEFLMWGTARKIRDGALDHVSHLGSVKDAAAIADRDPGDQEAKEDRRESVNATEGSDDESRGEQAISVHPMPTDGSAALCAPVSIVRQSVEQSAFNNPRSESALATAIAANEENLVALRAMSRTDLEAAYIARGQRLIELEQRTAAFLRAAAALED